MTDLRDRIEATVAAAAAEGSKVISVEAIRAALDGEWTDCSMSEDDEPVHTWFSLSYSNFLVLHRSLMQSMPTEWQRRIVALFDEMDRAFAHVDHPSFHVQTGKWLYFNEISEADYERLGITLNCEDDPEQCREDGHECTYSTAEGEEIEPGLTRIFVPGPDPIPHYNRGRTRVPRVDELAEATP